VVPVHIAGRRFAVLGAARSGVAVTRLLRAAGALVFVSDNAPREKKEEAAQALAQLGVAHEFGGHSARVLEADTIVISPGVPDSVPIVQEAMHRGIALVSELEVSGWFCPGPIVAITGTNGKTTTTTLCARMFEDARMPVVVGGNIDPAFADVVGAMTPRHTAVLEVSSFQLDHVRTFRPRVAVLLNITPDHLDRYDHDFSKYVESKSRVFAFQGAGDTVIYNDDDDETRRAVDERLPAGVRRLPFSIRRTLTEGAWVEEGKLMTSVHGRHSGVIGTHDISIRGMHNLYNAMAATLSAQVMAVSTASLRATLRDFKGVEHRLEIVRTVNGVTYINDSKATNVDSVWYAIQSYDAPLILLLGGRDKGNDYARLENLVRKHVKAIIAIGESAAKVQSSFAGIVPVQNAPSMEQAVHTATLRAERGDIVLLSPACASFDWFTNYEHRGRVFKEIVRALPGEDPC
jgi:UDP-N-acetylmuramoylalanine--D-glutamate ligase